MTETRDFPTEVIMLEKAKWFRTHAEASARLPHVGARVYHCRFCDGYHITTKPKLAE